MNYDAYVWGRGGGGGGGGGLGDLIVLKVAFYLLMVLSYDKGFGALCTSGCFNDYVFHSHDYYATMYNYVFITCMSNFY